MWCKELFPFVSRWSMHSWQILLSVQLKMVSKRDAEKILDDVWRHGWWKPSQGAYRRPQGSEPEQEDLFKGCADQRPQHFFKRTLQTTTVLDWTTNMFTYLAFLDVQIMKDLFEHDRGVWNLFGWIRRQSHRPIQGTRTRMCRNWGRVKTGQPWSPCSPASQTSPQETAAWGGVEKHDLDFDLCYRLQY